jgi:hypothetical protein
VRSETDQGVGNGRADAFSAVMASIRRNDRGMGVVLRPK